MMGWREREEGEGAREEKWDGMRRKEDSKKERWKAKNKMDIKLYSALYICLSSVYSISLTMTEWGHFLTVTMSLLKKHSPPELPYSLQQKDWCNWKASKVSFKWVISSWTAQGWIGQISLVQFYFSALTCFNLKTIYHRITFWGRLS